MKEQFPLTRSLIAFAFAWGTVAAVAGTNGFVAATFRGSPNSEAGYWESFSIASGEPGNLPDMPGATTGAVLTQSDPGALIAGSGNLYNPGGISSFALNDATPWPLATVALQVRGVGAEIDYNSVSLTYSNSGGVLSLAPIFRYELSRMAMPGQGSAVSSLWQWDLSGLNLTNYTIVFQAAGASLSLDSITLDTAAQWAPAFVQQPFRIQATAANLARWMYPFNGDPAGRTTASTFGSLGDSPDFDSRDAQYLIGWSTTQRVPAGQGAKNYAIRRARVTLTIATGNTYVYQGTLRDYRSYFPTNDARYVPAGTTNCPVELFGAGFRGGFTNEQAVYVPWASTNYPQDGPFFADPNIGQNGPYSTNRVAYAAGFNTNGPLVDVSNNVGDDGTNEIANPFEVAPFAVGQTTNVAAGELMPLRSQLTFELNLDDPLIYGYVQSGLDAGNLSFVASSFAKASLGGPPRYPNFYTIFAAVASNYFPLLDIEGEVIRETPDSDADALPDDWENFQFGSLANGAAADPDGDNAGNLAEYKAGTIPTAGTNGLHILGVKRQFAAADVHFSYAPHRAYSILWSSDLQSWQTQTNPTLYYSSPWLSKAGTNLTYPSPVYAGWHDSGATNPARFYRVGVH